MLYELMYGQASRLLQEKRVVVAMVNDVNDVATVFPSFIRSLVVVAFRLHVFVTGRCWLADV